MGGYRDAIHIFSSPFNAVSMNLDFSEKVENTAEESLSIGQVLRL